MKGFTLIELLIVVIIIGILATLAIPRYNDYVEKARSAEVYPVFKLARQGYQVRKMQGLIGIPIVNGYDPAVDIITNPAWQAMDVENPNADPYTYFTYDVWKDSFSMNQAPVNANRNVIISFRRTKRSAYSIDLDLSKYIYMDLDTGETFKSKHY